MHVLWQGAVFYIHVLGTSPAPGCAACTPRFLRAFSILQISKGSLQARGMWKPWVYKCWALPTSCFAGEGQQRQHELRALWVSGWDTRADRQRRAAQLLAGKQKVLSVMPE